MSITSYIRYEDTDTDDMIKNEIQKIDMMLIYTYDDLINNMAAKL
jgi:hypothetical protein